MIIALLVAYGAIAFIAAGFYTHEEGPGSALVVGLFWPLVIFLELGMYLYRVTR